MKLVTTRNQLCESGCFRGLKRDQKADLVECGAREKRNCWLRGIEKLVGDIVIKNYGFTKITTIPPQLDKAKVEN